MLLRFDRTSKLISSQTRTNQIICNSDRHPGQGLKSFCFCERSVRGVLFSLARFPVLRKDSQHCLGFIQEMQILTYSMHLEMHLCIHVIVTAHGDIQIHSTLLRKRLRLLHTRSNIWDSSLISQMSHFWLNRFVQMRFQEMLYYEPLQLSKVRFHLNSFIQKLFQLCAHACSVCYTTVFIENNAQASNAKVLLWVGIYFDK